jgi:hypothetical protein
MFLLEDLSSTTWLAIYAAVISTLALLWNIIQAVFQYRARLFVEYSFGFTLTTDHLGHINGGKEHYLSCRVTNAGRQVRHIEKPMLQVSREFGRRRFLKVVQIDERVAFPRELKAGEVFDLRLNLQDLFDQALDTKRSSCRIWFVVYDTLHRRYTSKKFSVATVKERLNDG